VHFGSAQADFAAAARAHRIPVGMLLYSWDNLSTKGCLHRAPDWMFVWNERQRTEARALHEFPEDRVIVTGAPRFDSFFELCPRISRDEFHAPLGLDPGKPTILYVCSSVLVSAGELAFVRARLAAIRGSSSAGARRPLRDCNIMVRPHPDIELLGDDQPFDEITWPSVRGAKGFVARPFDDPTAIVLKTADRAAGLLRMSLPQRRCGRVEHQRRARGRDRRAPGLHRDRGRRGRRRSEQHAALPLPARGAGRLCPSRERPDRACRPPPGRARVAAGQ
jgi:hypothetical protein